MTPALDDPTYAAGRFGIGQSVTRKEDPTLLTGQGRYTDDINLEGQRYAYVLRSPYAHGVLNGIDLAAAKTADGVHLILTGADLDAEGYGAPPCVVPLKNPDGSERVSTQWKPLPTDRVRYAGEAVALVVADSLAQARDAAELIELDIDPLPAVTDATHALSGEAAEIWPELTDHNRVVHWQGGDKDAVDQAFAAAAHTASITLTNNRLVVNPIEPRAAIAEFDARQEKHILHVGSQGVFGLRNNLADNILKVDRDKLQVGTHNVGGSFGMKIYAYPEYAPLLLAAKRLGRPVKWTDDRSGAFLSDLHGRDSRYDAEIALNAEGDFLAVRVTVTAGMGAYLSMVGPMMQTLNILKNVAGAYKTPAFFVDSQLAFTNTTPVAAYRGAGRPEGNYIMESLVDAAARVTGIDRLELRRRNLVPAEAMPFTAGNGQVFDSGDFAGLFEDAVKQAGLGRYPERKADSEARGLWRGLGVSPFCEVTATPGDEMGGIRFDADGGVTIVTGTLDYGQGHAGTFAQILVDHLGVPFEKVRLLQGDSDQLLAGGGTGGSRSVMSTGAALVAASQEVIEKGKKIAGFLFESAPGDIEFAAGLFRVAGTDREIDIMELARQARTVTGMPDDIPSDLTVELVNTLPDAAYPNGCHICEVEIDPETGAVRLVRYMMVNDFGVLVNPMLVAGQAQGGAVQGAGQVLMEQAIYDPDGQLLTGSFMDYAMPRASDMPMMDFISRPTPAKTNPLGVKGCGEAGTSGALPAVACAVNDAMANAGAGPVSLPATPEKVWRALRAVGL
ncbi:MAG: xanthine dehydrogenase family protein molybdopterin-binding subunit [Alphaproteobacteria bacterium]|nr:xanthine dehydrogenase family protein molybdopterin-binding subunit [Alphaproteobacteria bacterium]